MTLVAAELAKTFKTAIELITKKPLQFSTNEEAKQKQDKVIVPVKLWLTGQMFYIDLNKINQARELKAMNINKKVEI